MKKAKEEIQNSLKTPVEVELIEVEIEKIKDILKTKDHAVFSYREDGFFIVVRKDMENIKKNDLIYFVKENVIDKKMKINETKHFIFD